MRTCESLLQQVESEWREAGLAVSPSAFPEDISRVLVHVGSGQVEPVSTIALRTLQRLGCRTGIHRSDVLCSVFGFSESGSLCIDVTFGVKSPSSPWRSRRAPCVALLGPDGVGKSTALRLVKEWFANEAPFVDITVRQWRPGLLPPLAALLGKGGDGDGDQRPRRHKGNLQWFRLFYYFLDFLLGAWWKDRESSPGSRLIVYDRCALDLDVDPYRFALSSRHGTRLLWRFTPRPETLILLFDTPERIARRKDDLREHEMAEQLESWLKLAAEDEVHAIIRVDAGPREIANRVRDLFIDSLVRDGGSGFPAAIPPPGEYATLPSYSAARFLIPLDSRKTAAAALKIYNPQRTVARIAKTALRLGLRLGIAQHFLRRRAGLGSLAKVQDFLRSAVNCDDITVAVSLGTSGPNRKPTVQIMNRSGEILGYAKVGRTARGIASIRNEEQALRTLKEVSLSTAAIPRLLKAGWVGNSYVLVQSSSPKMEELRPAIPDERHIHFLAELHSLNPTYRELPFPGAAGLAELRRGGFHYYAHLIELTMRRWSDPVEILCGPAHGDFTPWNIRSDSGKLFVFDWETFDERTPAGWDLFHMIVAGGVEVCGARPGTIHAAITSDGRLRELIESYFRQIGSASDSIEPAFASYAANALCTSILDLRNDASEKDRELQRTWAALLALFLYRDAAPVFAAERGVAAVGSI